MTQDDRQCNPYAAPQTIEPLASDIAEPRLGIYRARLTPRDAMDCAIGLPTGVIGASLILGIPMGLLGALGAPDYLFAVVLMIILFWAIAVMLVGIQKLTITREGLIAHRTLLPPLHIAWSDVLHIRELSRFETFRAGYLAPHRCCSQSLTYLHQFRIETRTGNILFPPQEVGEFEATVETLWSQARSGQVK